MNDYYEILGVSRHATAAEIKRVYRKLVVAYHPDKNQDPSAHQKIAEINAAYDVLSDPEKRRTYDLRFYSAVEEIVEQEQPQHRDPAYRRRRPPVYQAPKKSSTQEMIERYTPAVAKLSLASFILCMILAVDWALPASTATEKIIYSYYVKGKYSSSSRYRGGGVSTESRTVFVTNENRHYTVAFEDIGNFAEGNWIQSSRSLLLRIPFSITSPSGYKATFGATIYRNFSFAPLLLLVASSVGLFLKTNPKLRLDAGITSVLLLLITLYFLFSSKLIG